ncbi:MAG: type II secretion system protein [bacterium]
MKNNGFTLIEVLIVLLIIGVIGFAVFPIFPYASNVLFSAGSKTDSIFEANNNLLSEMDSDTSEESSLIFSNSDSSIIVKSEKYIYQNKFQKPNKEEDTLFVEYFKYDND